MYVCVCVCTPGTCGKIWKFGRSIIEQYTHTHTTKGKERDSCKTNGKYNWKQPFFSLFNPRVNWEVLIFLLHWNIWVFWLHGNTERPQRRESERTHSLQEKEKQAEHSHWSLSFLACARGREPTHLKCNLTHLFHPFRGDALLGSEHVGLVVGLHTKRRHVFFGTGLGQRRQDGDAFWQADDLLVQLPGFLIGFLAAAGNASSTWRRIVELEAGDAVLTGGIEDEPILLPFLVDGKQREGKSWMNDELIYFLKAVHDPKVKRNVLH